MKIAIPDLVSNSYFPALAAVELGCFKEQGIAAEIALVFPPNRAYEALRDGEVDIVAASAHAAVSAFDQWQGARLLCAQSRGMYWFLVVDSRRGLARGDLAGLKGLRIGAAPWVELGLRGVLAQAGLDPERDGIAIGTRPLTVLKSVVLPAPLGPIRPQISSCATSKLACRNAWMPPKLTPTSVTFRKGSVRMTRSTPRFIAAAAPRRRRRPRRPAPAAAAPAGAGNRSSPKSRPV